MIVEYHNEFVNDYKKYKSAISDTKPLRKRLYISLVLLLFFCISDKPIGGLDFFIVSVEGLSADSAVIILCLFLLCFAVIHLWKFFVVCRDYRIEGCRKTVLKVCCIPEFFDKNWFGTRRDIQTLFGRERKLLSVEKRNEFIEIIGNNMLGAVAGKTGSQLIVFLEMILIPWIIPWVSLVVAIAVLFYKVSL